MNARKQTFAVLLKQSRQLSPALCHFLRQPHRRSARPSIYLPTRGPTHQDLSSSSIQSATLFIRLPRPPGGPRTAVPKCHFHSFGAPQPAVLTGESESYTAHKPARVQKGVGIIFLLNSLHYRQLRSGVSPYISFQ